MNQKSVKRLRKLMPPQDLTSRRTYRRLKKSYTKIKDQQAKEDFLFMLENLQNTSNINKLEL